MGIARRIARPITRRLTSAISQIMGSSAFSPISLFGASDQGVWYDLDDDMDTKLAWCIANPGYTNATFLAQFPNHALFQDSAGTTAVTAVEQSLGLVLDKSKGAVGTANLLTNGYFETDVSGWSAGFGAASSTLTQSAGNAVLSTLGADTNPRFVSSITGLTIGATYFLSFVLSAVSGATDRRIVFTTASNGTGGVESATLGAAGSYRFLVTATATTMYVAMLNAGSSAGVTSSFSEVVLRTAYGNHRTQATTGSKPKWSARKNWAVQTNDLSNAAWTKTNIDVTGGSTDPDGGTAAYKLTGTAALARLEQFFPSGIGQAQNTQSFWIRRVTGTGQISTFNGGAYVPLTVTSSWTRVSQASLPTPPSSYLMVRIDVSGDEVEVWHPQLEYGSVATTYQSVVTATDYNAIGFPKFATYDGVDDGMATASIDFTATDTMSSCVGWQINLVPAGRTMLYNGIGDPNSVNGSFGQNANSDATSYGVNCRGTQMSGGITPVSANTPYVTSAYHNLAGGSHATNNTLRENGVAKTLIAQGNSTTGGGTFGTGVIEFGKIVGSTGHFTGVEYQSVVINHLLTPEETAQLENYIAQKTGVTLP